MTIITKPITSVKEEKAKEVLVPLAAAAGLSSGDVAITITNVRRPNGRPAADPVAARRARRATCLSQTCLLLTATAALAVGFIGAVHIAKQMRAPRYHRGFCQVRIPYDSMISGDFRDGDGGAPAAAEGLDPVLTPEVVGERLRLAAKEGPGGSVELDYELDLELEEFEEFQMPQLSHGRYLHDFKVNQTAIIDPDGGRCFVMPLDRAEVPKPRSFYEIVKNMRDGVYGLDMGEIRVDTRVVLPPVEDISQFGIFIEAACTGRTTYRLREVDEILIAKRSADPAERDYQFVEFTGKTLVKYNILNLGQAQ